MTSSSGSCSITERWLLNASIRLTPCALSGSGTGERLCPELTVPSHSSPTHKLNLSPAQCGPCSAAHNRSHCRPVAEREAAGASMIISEIQISTGLVQMKVSAFWTAVLIISSRRSADLGASLQARSDQYEGWLDPAPPTKQLAN